MEAIPKRKFRCLDCGYEFEEPFGKPRWMVKCPKCASGNIVRVNAPSGWCGRGRRWREGQGRGWGWRGKCRW